MRYQNEVVLGVENFSLQNTVKNSASFPMRIQYCIGQLVFHVICKFISEGSITSHQPELNNSSTHPPTLFLQNHFTTILTSMPRYSKWLSLPFMFLNKHSVYISHIHVCYVPRPAHNP